MTFSHIKIKFFTENTNFVEVFYPQLVNRLTFWVKTRMLYKRYIVYSRHTQPIHVVLTTLKILMLEDSISEAELVQRQLKQALPSCHVLLVGDKISFLRALDEFEPDLVLSDNKLPQYSGPEALQEVRSRSRKIPFILLTGTVSDEFAAGILKAGADDYILKDRLERLPSAITTVIRQKRVEKELADYRQALDASSIVAMTDQKGQITYVNDNFCKISQYTKNELLGSDHKIVNSGYHPAAYIEGLWRTIAQGNIWRGEFRNRAKDGSLYWVDATIIPFLDKEGKPYQYLSIRNDITEKKQAEKELERVTAEMMELRIQEQKKIARAIMKAQEKERNHIGRELHDNVNQILAGTRLYLGLAAQKSPAAAEMINYSMDLLNNAIEEIRLLSARQVTPIRNVDLEQLAGTLVHDLQESAHIDTGFTCNIHGDQLADDLKLAVYRILQEQVANILKHSAATRVEVTLETSAGTLQVCVSDNGQGFDPESTRNGIGISNMINRVESFNGTLNIDSQPGHGCRMEISIPLLLPAIVKDDT